MLFHLLLCVASMLFCMSNAHDIRDFGALANDTSLNAEQTNAVALMDAIVAANTTTDDRTVVIPANFTFSTMPVWGNFITNVTFQIDGTLKLSKAHHHFTMRKEGKISDLFYFEDVSDVTFQGSGVIDGQGYMWWVREVL